ncbi:MAG TPA: glutamate--tRNA ligase family protein [Gaiellales bacterium]|nr:glutamate--tRNA ligase family protein [Gaiellales bacterium]
MSPKVRFAPSPTGSLHLGSALTAVANWLFARRHGGTVLLRIDDTDDERELPGAQEEIERDLEWLGLSWDEGPARQSDRRQRHLEAAAAAQGAYTRDGAVWLSAPGASEFVIVRSDGRPTYRWASAVDDVDFGITHVIRGNDHLPNTALQVAAIRALGAEPPEFLHHALVREGDGGKLSKRAGASSLASLRAEGYPPEAVVNLLALVATSGPGDVMIWDELVGRFDESRLARGEIVLEPSRLRALSTAHLAALPPEQLAERVTAFTPGADPALVRALAPALRGAHTLAEAADLVACVSQPPEPHPVPELATIRSRYPERLSEQDARSLVDELRSAGVPLREARVALTGRERGPELWAVLAALPRDEAIRRAA